MKHFATILFLTIARFNLGAYRLLTGYLQNRANTEMESSLDHREYSDDDLVLIKTPLQLPYYSSSAFERVSGELTIKGVVYKYVKRRVQNDTLELLCIRDNRATSIRQAKDEIYKQSNGLTAQSKKSSSSNTSKPVFFDYCSLADHFSFGYLSSTLRHFSFYIPFSSTPAARLAEQPPEV